MRGVGDTGSHEGGDVPIAGDGTAIIREGSGRVPRTAAYVFHLIVCGR
jgi:hypothetical protein